MVAELHIGNGNGRSCYANRRGDSPCRGVWLFDDVAKYDARTGNVYDGVLEVHKSAELDTRNDYQGAEEIAEPEA